MKLNYTTGCIEDTMLVNGKHFKDLSVYKRMRVINKILNHACKQEQEIDNLLEKLFVCLMENTIDSKLSVKKIEIYNLYVQSFDLDIK